MTQLDNLSAPTAQAAPAATAGKGQISGTVELAAALKGKAGANDTVFIMARGPNGGMPLAILKGKVSELPVNFELNDSTGMGQGPSLSSQQTVTVLARVSKSGQAMPQAGDLEGSLTQVKVGSTGVKIVIDKAR